MDQKNYRGKSYHLEADLFSGHSGFMKIQNNNLFLCQTLIFSVLQNIATLFIFSKNAVHALVLNSFVYMITGKCYC